MTASSSEGLRRYTFRCNKPEASPHLFVVDAVANSPEGQCSDPECPDRGSFGELVGEVGGPNDIEARKRLPVRPPDS